MTETTGIEEKAVELIEKFEALAADIAPDAVELGLMTARIAATQEILSGIVGIVGAMLCVKYAAKFWRPFAAAGYFASEPEEQIPNFALSIFFGAASALVFLALGTRIFSIWPFVGIFYPELWIAKQVLGW